MSAVFILSFDCEGKWGIADHVTTDIEPHFTNARLNQAYDSILSLLEKYRIFATFAFVGAFTLSKKEFLERRDWFPSEDPWLYRFHQDLKNDLEDGWLNPKAFEKVANIPGHEIACHGFTHRALCESSATREKVRAELTYLRKLSHFNNADTFIYPRNLVGYENLLPEFGFSAYRAGVSEPRKPWQRVKSLLAEANVFAHSEKATDADSRPFVIPGGHIINWRRGMRKAVPVAISLRRVQSMIRHATANHQVVHLWSHPHNFVTGAGMYDFFESILKIAAKERDAGRLEVLTQTQYVASRKIAAKSYPVLHGQEVVSV